MGHSTDLFRNQWVAVGWRKRLCAASPLPYSPIGTALGLVIYTRSVLNTSGVRSNNKKEQIVRTQGGTKHIPFQVPTPGTTSCYEMTPADPITQMIIIIYVLTSHYNYH